MQLPYNQVIWLFGLSGAGKSTLAAALTSNLRDQRIPVLELDGDTLRNSVCRGLGFDDVGRTENLRRSGEVARLGVQSGLCVVASFITPLESHRVLIKEIVGLERISLIFADSPLEVCRQRDVKGLYARAQAGQVDQMTGISSAFERPVSADLILNTAAMRPAESARELFDFTWKRLGLGKLATTR